MRSLAVVLLAACTVPSEPTGKDPTTPADTDLQVETDQMDTDDPDTDLGADSDPGLDPPDAANDAPLIRALIADGGDVAQVLHTVAWSGGWPAWAGDDTWLFLAPGDDPWLLAGDFNGWTPAPMVRAEGFSWAEVQISEPWDLGYKLVRDVTGREPEWLADPWARSYRYDENGRLSLVLPGSDRPHLERWPGLEGQGLRPRDVDVWVPAGEGPWPLLVMHDGRNLFDPEAIWGGWRLSEALTAASGDVLVVALDNTPDRMSEYTHARDTVDGIGTIDPLGAEYADLVALDVVPWAEATWSTDGRRGVMGSSLGGLISLFIAHRHPDTFDFAASLSGTLGWGRFGEDELTVGELFEAEGRRDTMLYLDSGGGPGADGRCTDPDRDGWTEDDPDSNDNYCETRQVADTLAGVGYVWEEDLVHWWEEDAPHNELAWAARVQQPIDLFLALP